MVACVHVGCASAAIGYTHAGKYTVTHSVLIKVVYHAHYIADNPLIMA